MEVVGKLVFPGQSFDGAVLAERCKQQKVVIGNGLTQSKDQILVTKAGYFRFQAPAQFWVENNQRRYVPRLEDIVIGIVAERHSESYKVDIGSAHMALLGTTSFEGATKRNRPNLAVGALVFCRVVVADKDMEPEVSCVSLTSKHGWMTGQAIFGELKEGYMFTCDQELAVMLANPQCDVLDVLGTHFPYEVTAGVNGRVWVNSERPSTTIVAARMMQLARTFATKEDMEKAVIQMLSSKDDDVDMLR